MTFIELVGGRVWLNIGTGAIESLSRADTPTAKTIITMLSGAQWDTSEMPKEFIARASRIAALEPK